nr:hypothetical protein [Thermoanaerobacter indiensis]
MYHGDDAYMWEENRTKKYKGIDIIEFYQKEAIKRKNTIPKKTFYNRFLKIGDHIMISKPYPENSVSQKGNKKLNPYRCKNMG